MSGQKKFNQSRRQLLKGIACGSALSVGGLSVAAFASSTSPKILDKQTITLFNQSDKTVTLRALQPVCLEKMNGWVVVKINKASEQNQALTKDETISLAAGQRLSIPIDADQIPLLKATGDYIVITSEFTALNNMIPISTYDVAVA